MCSEVSYVTGIVKYIFKIFFLQQNVGDSGDRSYPFFGTYRNCNEAFFFFTDSGDFILVKYELFT